VKHALVRGSGGKPPTKMLEFRFSESASAGYPHLKHKLTESTLIPSIHGRFGRAICSYNMLGIRMYVGLTKQFLEVVTKKIKTQHILVTSRSQMCMGAKQPYPMESTTSNYNTEQGCGHTN